MEMEKRICAQLSIPEEIVHDIFSRLPIKSLARFKCVSRFCKTLVLDPSFLDIHENQYNKIEFLASWRSGDIVYTTDLKDGDGVYTLRVEHGKASVLPIEKLDGFINYPRLSYVKGLFLFWSIKRQPPVIYNPITRKVRSLRLLNLDVPYYYYSLGFEPDEKKYKVLMITDAIWIHTKRYWVFTLGTTESWREIKSAHSFTPLRAREGVCIDGTIYFYGYYNNIIQIVAFNVRTENFRIISLREDRPYNQILFDLMELEGKLAAMYIKDWKEEMNLWILDQRSEIGTEEWVKHIISFPQSLSFGFLINSVNRFCGGSTPDGEIVLTNFVLKPNWMFFYNLKKKSRREIELINVLPEKVKTFGVYSYIESLLSLRCI